MSLLSVAIPTRNRPGNLVATLRDLQAAAADGPPLEVAILDNSSTDDTARTLDEGEWPGLALKRFPGSGTLTGAESVSRALAFAADGPSEYGWILSDHMRVHPDALRHMREVLDRGRPHFVYAAIQDYGTPGSMAPGFIGTRARLSPRSIRQFVLFTSNLSGVLARREVFAAASPRIGAYAQYGFPHLACVEIALRDEAAVLGVSQLATSFQQEGSYAVEYGVVRSRAIGFGSSIELLRASTGIEGLRPREILRERAFNSWLRNAILTWACNASAEDLSPEDIRALEDLYGTGLGRLLRLAGAARHTPSPVGQAVWALHRSVTRLRAPGDRVSSLPRSICEDFALARLAHRSRSTRAIF